MRIVAGEFRGRRLLTPKGRSIRPTTDRVREAIFSIIMSHLAQARVLDLFAGTGALGLEALSRGAAHAVFVDETVEAVRLIRANIELCGAQDRADVVQGAVQRVLQRLSARNMTVQTFQLIFMDPPYGKGLVEKTLLQLHPLAHASALGIAEHHSKDVVASRIGDWVKKQERKYGDTVVSFFERVVGAC